jgi:HSP20 family protein
MPTASRLPQVDLVPFDWTSSALRQRVPGTVRIEESIDGQDYELRTEAPGLNPAKDITVVYHDGALRVEIFRTDVREDKTRTEFHYATYGPTVSLPDGVDEESIKASYVTASSRSPRSSFSERGFDGAGRVCRGKNAAWSAT